MKKIIITLSLGVVLCMSACGAPASQTAETSSAAASSSASSVAESKEAEATAEPTEEATPTPTPEPTEEATPTPTPEPTEEPGKALFTEQGKVLLDNDLVLITLEDEVEESNYVGYSAVIENKTDMNILVSIENGSVDGVMTYIHLDGATVAAGKKSKATLCFYDYDSLDDLKNIEGSFSISTNTDGGSSYTGTNDRYPFQITGRDNGEESKAEEPDGPVLVDNDQVKIILGDTFQDESSVGYNIMIENKTDQYILVSVDNGSVDGFMTYIHVDGSTLAPGKKSYSKLSFYDLTSLDELKNVEGAFTVSLSDNGSVYTGSDTNYPFAIGENGEAESSKEESEEKSEEDTAEVSAEEVDAALQGSWYMRGGIFSFVNGDVSLMMEDTGEVAMSGTYEVNVDDSTIDASFIATDGVATIHLPFEYADGNLTLYNNNNEVMEKM